jgi:DNA-binding CsgD family transcriptional regulator
MQVLLNKQKREQLVIKMYHQGKTMREIAQIAHMSFTDIKKTIQKIDGLKDENENIDMKNKSKNTQALYLFSIGKTALEFAIALDISTNEVHEIQEEFWALNQLHELAFVYGEIKNFLPSFMKLYRSLKERRMLNEEYLSNLLKYAGHDLPELTYRLQQVANEVIDLESKKRQSIDTLLQLDDKLSWYHRNINLNKQILSDLDKKINQSNEKRPN